LGHSRRRVLNAGAGLGVALAAACAAQPGATPAGQPRQGSAGTVSGRITWLVRSQQVENDWQQQVVLPAMQQRYPQIQIEREVAPPDVAWNEKVFALHAAGTPPDVHNGIVGTFIQLYAQNKLVELGPLAARDKLDLKAFGGFEKDQDMCRSGKQWMLPVLTTLGQMTFYNATLLEQAGVPAPPTSWQDKAWTLDRLVDAGRKTVRGWGQPDAVYGVLPFGGIALHAWAYLWGGDPFPKEFYAQGIAQQSTWSSPAVVEALQFYADLSLKQQIAPPPGATSKPFREGGAALWLNTGWNTSDLRQVSLFKWGIAPIPWQATNKTLSFTDGILITNLSQAQDAAWQLVKYLTGQEGQLAYSKATGRPPTRPDSFEPWLDATMALPGMAMKSKDQLRQVVTGYLGNHVDNWAHYVVNAGAYQDIQRDVEAKILGAAPQGALAVGPALAEMKTRMDAQMKETYEQFKSSQLVRDTPCS
jgi:multiple sugar transport system substrate-binding protein